MIVRIVTARTVLVKTWRKLLNASADEQLLIPVPRRLH